MPPAIPRASAVVTAFFHSKAALKIGFSVSLFGTRMLLSRAEDRAMRGRNPSAGTGRGWLGYGDMPRRFLQFRALCFPTD
jgi:hypothetical protein